MIGYAQEIARAYKNKVTNKLFGVVHIPEKGVKRGNALLSLSTEPFTQTPSERYGDPHNHSFACTTIASLLSERGYAVDVIAWDNTAFVPRKPYALFIDIHGNLERLAPLLPRECLKVLFVEAGFTAFHNAAERKRLDDLERRRGVRLSARRQVPENEYPAFADYLVGYGNRAVFNTFARFHKPTTPIPTPVMAEFDFPDHKDFAVARRSFLWFGGGGAVHKGLDLVLEALANDPAYELHVVGPVAAEKDFMAAYAAEFAAPNVHLYPRPRMRPGGGLTIGEEDFMSVMNRCAAVIFPSASEGGGASAVQAMHAGLIPIVTAQSGISDDAPAIVIEPTIDAIRTAAERLRKSEPAELRQHARSTWEYARTHCTQDAFRAAWGRFFDAHLTTHGTTHGMSGTIQAP